MEMTMTEWKLVSYDDLTPKELYQMLKLRVDVFVVEQNCPYPDLDNNDIIEGVYHLLATKQDGNIAACARLLPAGISYENVSIGRVATKIDERGHGLGHQLIQKAIEGCESLWGTVTIDISAQQYLEKYYQSHGFTTISEMYLEDDIPHIKMRKS
jgi:ElaA protein